MGAINGRAEHIEMGNTMSDEEFDVMDELYFVQPFSHLIAELDLEEQEMVAVLAKLVRKGWVRCLKGMDDEVPDEALDLETEYANYFYLATKQGLLAHNGR